MATMKRSRKKVDRPTVESRAMAPVMIVDEARRVLRMRKAAVYDLIKSGALKTFRRGRGHYCTDTALRACIAHLEANSTGDESDAA